MVSIGDKARALARHAARLRAGRPGGSTAAPFDIALFTDERAGDPVAVAAGLPAMPGIRLAVIFRHYDSPDRAGLARALGVLCRQRRISLLIAGDPGLAGAVRADGVHFPEWQIPRIAGIRHRRPDWILSAACHSPGALHSAAIQGADLAFLAPVFATASHPGAPGLGLLRAQKMAAGARLPVMALGGVTAEKAGKLKPGIFAGFGAIDGLSALRAG